MKIINDAERLQRSLQELKLDARFDVSRLHPRLCFYEKGELLSGPAITQRDLLFLVTGVAQIYGIGIDGRKIPVNLVRQGSMIGDIEFCNARNSNLFVEAMKDTLCVGFPIREDRGTLENDLRFLRYMLSELSKKVYLTSFSETPAVSVEEKLLQYMREECERGTLRGVEHAAMRLQCSRRQLQRVLSELCETGEIERIGKGVYRLAR